MTKFSAQLSIAREAIVACDACPRLRNYCTDIAREKRRAYREETYWGKPVPGFGDPRAVKLPSGRPVWNQPNGSAAVLPFRPTAPDLGLQFIEDLPKIRLDDANLLLSYRHHLGPVISDDDRSR